MIESTDLNQNQLERSNKIDSYKWYKYQHNFRSRQNTQEYQKDGSIQISLNFKVLNKWEKLETSIMHKIIILVHTNLSYIQLVKETRAWLCTISKYLQSLQNYTFKICKNTTQWLLNHTKSTPAQQDNPCRPRKPLSTTQKLEKDQT